MVVASQQILKIPLEEIFPDLSQPRKTFLPEEIDRMAASIVARGILQPIRVRWDEQRGCWIIVSGESRWRAAKPAGLAVIPCLPVEGEPSETDILSDQIIENTVRNSLRPLQLANALARLKALRGCNSQTLAKELGISGSAITRAESLLTLPDDVQTLVDDGAVPESSAYELSRMPDETAMRELAQAVASGRLNRQGVIDAVHRTVRKKNVAPKTSRLSCRLEGGLSVTVSAGGPLTWDALLDAIDRMRKEARKLCDAGREPAALAQVLRAS